ncbi:hypothetical protein BpHYR1_011658 [Brachionus plicatilis]|uniref:Uncharacterized protein n=1 Tax=Brachionus plicatilis TaxID=10195 RepID=A0A3M7S795_BRAPC|nr:hypothetical protein BpHYR1_011658 [Brachionus plicatilis]
MHRNLKTLAFSFVNLPSEFIVLKRKIEDNYLLTSQRIPSHKTEFVSSATFHRSHIFAILFLAINSYRLRNFSINLLFTHFLKR